MLNIFKYIQNFQSRRDLFRQIDSLEIEIDNLKSNNVRLIETESLLFDSINKETTFMFQGKLYSIVSKDKK